MVTADVRKDTRFGTARRFGPTHPRPLQGGEHRWARARIVPLLGGVRGGFVNRRWRGETAASSRILRHALLVGMYVRDNVEPESSLHVACRARHSRTSVASVAMRSR